MHTDFRHQVSKLSFSAFLLIAVLLPFGIRPTSIAITIWAVFYFADRTLNKGNSFFKVGTTLSLLMFSYFGLLVVGLAYTTDLHAGFSKVETSLSLLLFAVAFSLGVNKFYLNKQKVIWTFISGNLLSAVACIVNAFYHSIKLDRNSIHFDATLSGTHGFFESTIHGDNWFYSEHFSLFIQTTYFSIFLFISIIFMFIFWGEYSRRRKIYVGLLIGLFSLCIYLLSSRAGILISVVAMFFFLLFEKKYGLITKISLCVFILVSFIISLQNPRFKDLINSAKSHFHVEATATQSAEVRLLAWRATIEIIKSNWLIGVGTGDTDNELQKVYKERGYNYLYEHEINSHNQYLHVFLSFGAIGLVVFLTLILHNFNLARVSNNKPLLFLLFILSLHFLFENMLSRLTGVVLFGYFVFLLNLDNSIWGDSKDSTTT